MLAAISRPGFLVVALICVSLPRAGLAQEVVLSGSSLPQDQGWSMSTNLSTPDVTTNGTCITIDTIDTERGNAARLWFSKDVSVTPRHFWVDIRLKVEEIESPHLNEHAAVGFIAYFSPDGTNHRKVIFDADEMGFWDSAVEFDTTDDFHTYRYEYEQLPDNPVIRIYIDGELVLTRPALGYGPNGSIAFGDETEVPPLNSRFQIESIVVFRDCDNNGVADSLEDCDTDGIQDVCQMGGYDCNANGELDECDLSGGSSLDANGDQYPDECPLVAPPPLLPDPTAYEKSKFISFMNPQTGTDATALRIRLVSLHHVAPPYSGAPTIPFEAFEGLSVWVGSPRHYIEAFPNQIPFLASHTQCTPYYQDWSTVGLLHVTGSAIVPSSIYEVEQVALPCRDQESTCALVSPPLTVKTTRWGDLELPFSPPSASAQPDLGDCAQLINKFRNAPGAPIKARAQLALVNAFGEISLTQLTLDFGFQSIAAVVDAFRGARYPAQMGKCANSVVACTVHADCGANGPCELFCPD